MNQQTQRLDVVFSITWDSGWHVGSGQGTAAVDRLVRKRVCGPQGLYAPFVPGSQIKGVLRHHCERLVVLLGGDVISPHLVTRVPDAGLLKQFRPLISSGLLIDRLFGTRFQGECLFVEDAIPNRPNELRPRLHNRTSIDRVSGTARDRTLFVTEVTQKDSSTLESKLSARHPSAALSQENDGFPFEYGMLLAGLLSLNELGGDKSTGLGSCRIEILGETVRWNKLTQFPLVDALKSFVDYQGEGEWSMMMGMLRETQAVKLPEGQE